MEKILKITVAVACYLLILITVGGCVKDDTTHDLIPLNKVEIEKPADHQTILQFDTLNIEPVIRQSNPMPDTDFDFNWYIRPVEGRIDKIVYLDNTRNLKKEIGVSKGEYIVVYEVTEKKTGVMVMQYFPLTVTDRLGKGWLLLEDINGKGDVSVIVPTDEVFHNVYSDLNRGTELSMPLRQIAVTETYGGKKIEILSASDAAQLDYAEMIKLKSFNDLFWTPPAVVKPQFIASLSLTNKILVNDGLLHVHIEGGFPGDVKYLSELPYFDNKGLDYSLAPFVASGPEPWDGLTPYGSVYFDTRSKGFGYVTNATLLPTMVGFYPPAPGAPFDMRSIGMDLLYMDRGYTNYFYNAIFKDNSNNLFLYQLNIALDDPAVSKKALGAGLNGSSYFASSQTSQFLYLFKDQKIYLYDIPLATYAEVGAIPASEAVTKMKVIDKKMQIATWDGSQGHFYIFDIDPRGNITQLKKFSGFGKVIDFTYKS